MSTQSIFQNNLEDIKDNLDGVFSCISDKLILSSKFGFKSSLTPSDTFLLNYLYDLVNKETNCYLIFDSECSIEKVNKLISKYK